MKKLQPLRIQSGWQVCYNTFKELDPKELKDENDENWWNLDEDLLQLENSSKDLILDLGWYGGHHLNSGVYKLYLIQNLDLENPLVVFISKDKYEVTTKIEELMKSY